VFEKTLKKVLATLENGEKKSDCLKIWISENMKFSEKSKKSGIKIFFGSFIADYSKNERLSGLNC
jgi:hypothetical protein